MESTETWAERLGWATGSVVAILHVDDAGMSHASNLGAIEALRGGLATSVSVMTPCSWSVEMGHYLRAHPETDAGVHLTLTSEMTDYRWFPLAGAGRVPGLVDPEGCFWSTSEEVVAKASPEEVELELRAQVEQAERLGIPLTHLDTHMGVVFQHPKFFESYLRIGVERRLPVLVAGGHSTYAAQSNPGAVQALRPWKDKIWASGLPVIDDIHALSYGWSAEEKRDRFLAVLRGLRPGITEIILHPTRPGADFAAISDSGPSRLADLEVLLDPEARRTVEERGIQLTTWRELMERREAI